MMEAKTFKHNTQEMPYKDLSSGYGKDGKRFYNIVEGVCYPSVTSVLSLLSRDGIAAWKKRIGEEKANHIATTAANLGTKVHDLLERVVKNEQNIAPLDSVLHNYMVHEMVNILNKNLDEVWSQEVALYSDKLRMAGRVDLVGIWNGVPSIIDYKTSKKSKKKEWCTSYFCQETAYAIMWEEQTGTPIEQLVTIIGYPTGVDVHIEQKSNWEDKLNAVIEQYYQENPINE